MPPLVLAIEPDLRQAAIVKRIVREQVLAEVTVVDTRDAALEAMRTKIPDVLLLSVLLSPRDEDELVAHLRTLENAEHLQTHTIPRLASSIGQDDEKPRGLLSAFRRRKGSVVAPAGCDPDLFADEIRTYLQRAAEKKRELADMAMLEGGSPARVRISPSGGAPSTRGAVVEDETLAPASSWASPFEWRPTRTTNSERTATTARSVIREPAPIAADVPQPVVIPLPEPAPEPLHAVSPEALEVTDSEPPITADTGGVDFLDTQPVAVVDPEPAVVAEPEPVVLAESAAEVAEPEPVAFIEPAPAIDADAQPVVATTPAPAMALESSPAAAMTPEPVVAEPEQPRKLPLVKRHAREWWFEDGEARPGTGTDSEVRQVLASLSVPFHVAAIGYGNGCRIRRVRLSGN
jgi:CheY-like chemotaxis protein